jgi:hypothetical protein
MTLLELMAALEVCTTVGVSMPEEISDTSTTIDVEVSPKIAKCSSLVMSIEFGYVASCEFRVAVEYCLSPCEIGGPAEMSNDSIVPSV